MALRNWLDVFTRIHHVPVSRRLAAYLLLMAVYTIGVDWFSSGQTKMLIQATGAIYGTYVLGMLIVFRTNSAYDRWWEARKLWGQLTNDTRNFFLKLSTFLEGDAVEMREFSKIMMAFPYALKDHLRDEAVLIKLPGYENDTMQVKHVPLYLSQLAYERLTALRKSGHIDGFQQMQLDAHLSALMDICGACERIKTSPIALSYRAIVRQGIGLNLLGLPWYLTSDFHWWSLPISLTASYFLIGLELIAEDIEEPFGRGDDNLPLERYCMNIETSVREIVTRECNEVLALPVVSAEPTVLKPTVQS